MKTKQLIFFMIKKAKMSARDKKTQNISYFIFVRLDFFSPPRRRRHCEGAASKKNNNKKKQNEHTKN
jgi:hypothetical protein